MNKGASGNNGQTKASQKGQQDKQQQELNKNGKKTTLSKMPTYPSNSQLCTRRIKRLYRECEKRTFDKVGTRNNHRLRVKVPLSTPSRRHKSNCKRRMSLLLRLPPRRRVDSSTYWHNNKSNSMLLFFLKRKRN